MSDQGGTGAGTPDGSGDSGTTEGARRTTLIAIIVGIVVIVLAVIAILVIVNRSGGDSGGSATPTATLPTTRPAPCPTGSENDPPEVDRLTLNGQDAKTFAGSLLVPYAGLDMPSTPERPVVITLEVVTSTSGSPVTFSADGGQLLQDLTTKSWLDAPTTVTVLSEPGTDRCLATAYLISTAVGTAAIEVNGATTTITHSVGVVTALPAARNVRLSTDEDVVAAGDSLNAGVRVTDAFGNNVEGALVDVELPAKGPATFASGSNTATIKTGSNGKASIKINTSPGGGAGFTIEASGDQQSCSATSNSYACAADQPALGLPAASGPRSRRVDIVEPAVDVSEPRPGDVYTEGEVFTVRAATVAVPDGTNVQVLYGDAVVGSGATAPDGRIEILDVPARETSNNRKYRLVVGNLASAELGIRVDPAPPQPTPTPTPQPSGDFGIVKYSQSGDRLIFTIDPGSFAKGTVVVLLDEGDVITKAKVVETGQEFEVDVPYRPGIYQVVVETPDGPVYGKDDVVVN